MKNVSNSKSICKLENTRFMGKLLKQARIAKNLTPGQLNELAGVDIPRSTLLHYEKKGPSQEAMRLLKLIYYYNIPISEFLGVGFTSDNDNHYALLSSYSDIIYLSKELNKLVPSGHGAILNIFVKFVRKLINGSGAPKPEIEYGKL